MPTRKELARQVERDRALLAKLEAGVKDIKRHLEWEEAELARMDREGTNEVLHERKHLATVNSMTSDHALAISKTQRGKDRKFRAAMHAAGFTQNDLADKLGISSASITRYRDKRPVPKAIADKIKTLTGFDGSWPGGVVD